MCSPIGQVDFKIFCCPASDSTHMFQWKGSLEHHHCRSRHERDETDCLQTFFLKILDSLRELNTVWNFDEHKCKNSCERTECMNRLLNLPDNIIINN